MSYSRGNAPVLSLSPFSLFSLFYTLSKRYNCCQLDTQTYTTALTFNVPPSINLEKVAQAQRNYLKLAELMQYLAQHSLVLQWNPLPLSGDIVICDIATGTPHPFVSSPLRNLVFTALHSLSHPGIRASQRLLVSRFVWPGMNKDVRKWTCQCLLCQHSKVHKHAMTPLFYFPIPKHRFTNLHIDLVGPLPPSGGCSSLLTIVDRFTIWSEAIPLVDATAETVTQAFISNWVSHFGVPTLITTDEGKQFESSLWSQLMKILDTQCTRTTTYHPIANVLVERRHRQIKAAIKCLPNPNDWISGLHWILLGIHTAFKEDIGCSSAQLVYGTTLRIPGELSLLILCLYQTQSHLLNHYGLLCSQSRLYLHNLTHVHHIFLMLFSQLIRMMDRSKLLREGINPLNSSLMGDMSMC